MKIQFKEDNKKDTISEVFGWDDAKFEKCVRKIVMALLEERFDSSSDKSKTLVLHEWLANDAERQGFTFETENDMFMLGYCFHQALVSSSELEHHHGKSDSGLGIAIPKGVANEAKKILREKLKEAVQSIKEKTGKDIGVIDSALDEGGISIGEEPSDEPKEKQSN